MIPALGTHTKILIASCIVVVSGVISWSLYLNRIHSGESLVVSASDDEASIENELTGTENAGDADGDGLPAWEEELWGTSDTNRDSDSDGTFDTDEIAAGRNPSKSAFEGNDLVASTTLDFSYSEEETDPNSLTSRIAKSVLGNVLQYANSDSYTEEMGTEIATQLSYAAVQESYPADVYGMSDVDLLTNPSKKDIKAYGNSVMAVIIGRLQQVYDDPTAFSDLSVVARAFRDTAVGLAELRVPQPIATAHVKIVNNYNAIYEALEDVYYYRKDPAKALLALRTYSEIAQKQPLEFQIIQDYFVSNDIIFATDEMGALGFPSLVGTDEEAYEND